MSLIARLLVATATCSIASAQIVSFSPNPATPGTLVDVTITDSTGSGLTLPSPCGWYSVHQGSQTGTQVGPPGFCIQVLISVPPNGSYTYPWDTTGMSTGRYWIRTNVFGPSSTINDFFCFDLVSPNDPTMTANGIVQVNNVTPFTINSPNNPNDLFVVLFSFDSNNPVVLPGFIDLCISSPIFALFDSSLDANGTSNAFSFFVPNQPNLAYSGFQLQTVVVDPALNFIDTNTLSLTIQP